ncbi:hypothetical protein SMC26_39585 [Actinomadura fulvescens]|uniref:WGR domain-containing protein n=1 Tax=Actinomadura fulvescens TaxID=46160 RepID=A0ABN3PZS5_9ACTN
MRTIAETTIIAFQREDRAFRIFRIVDGVDGGFGVQLFAGRCTHNGPVLDSLLPKDARWGFKNIAEARDAVRRATEHRARQGWGSGTFELADCA